MKKLFLFAALAFPAFLPGASTGGAVPAKADRPSLLDRASLDAIEGEVSGSLCFEHVRKLSGYDRRWGSRDYEEALAYLAGRAKAYQLSDVSVERIPIRTGREKFWMQSPGGYLPWECRKGTLRLIKPYPLLIADRESASCAVSDHSRSVRTSAELIFVGKGDAAKDYDGLDVRGKIVLSEGGNPEQVHELAVHGRGALGSAVYYVFPAKSVESDAVFWTRILPWSQDGKAKSTFGFSLSTNQGVALRDLLKKGEKVVVEAEINADLVPDGTFDLLTATIPGATTPEEEFLIYSHLDHPKPGAHDNAGSNATVLEIARTLSVLIERGLLPRPARTIRFLWMPHMSGLNMYLCRHPEKVGKIKAGLNLDCVGLDQAKYPSNFYVVLPPESLLGPLTDITNNAAGFFNRKLSRTVLEGTKKGLLFSPEGSRNMSQAVLVPYDGGSDEYTANTTSLNIPSLRFFDFPIPTRHNQLDVLDYIDPTALQRVSYLGALIAYGYAGLGPGTAPYLLNETEFQAASRMDRDLLKALNALEASGVDDVRESYRRGTLLLSWRAETERRSLAAFLTSLSPERGLQERLGLIRKELDEKAASSLEEFKRRYEETCRRLRVPFRAEVRRPQDLPGVAAVPVPSQDIKGSPGYFDTYFEDILGPGYLNRYPKIVHYFAYGSAGYYETLNYIDGKRSIRDIYEAVQAELWSGDYSPAHSLSLEETAEYMRLLKDARVIGLRNP